MAALPAAADPIAGATYTGVAADGATVAFTLSPDGTIVDSYRITKVRANNCMFTAEGDNAIWEGAPIVGSAFEYRYYDAISFQGTFAGAQSASGTFRLFDHATSATPACDTGTVSWTATTRATPPPGAGGSGPPSGGSGPPSGGSGGGSGGTTHRKPVFTTRLTLRRQSRTRLGGQIKSPSPKCRGGRTVILWRGSRRIARTRSKANGTYSFHRTKALSGRRVRASSPKRSLRAGACQAGSSIFIKA